MLRLKVKTIHPVVLTALVGGLWLGRAFSDWVTEGKPREAGSCRRVP